MKEKCFYLTLGIVGVKIGFLTVDSCGQISCIDKETKKEKCCGQIE